MNFNDIILWAQKSSDDTAWNWPELHLVFKSRGLQILNRDPNLGYETFHSWSRNNLNLHFKFAIVIRQNKCNHLVCYAQCFIQFCARKFLLSIVVLKMIFIYKAFSAKLYAHEMFGLQEFRTIFRAASKSVCGPLF